MRTRSSLLASLAAGAALCLTPFGGARAQADEGMLKLSLGYDGILLVKVLDMQIEQRATASGFSSSARLVSSGILALLKHINEQAVSQGRIVGGNPEPGTFEFHHLSGKTKRHVKSVWTGGDVEMQAAPAFDDLGHPPASRAQKMAAADPLTELMRLTLNASRENACGRTYHFFDGKQLYDLDFFNQRAAPLTAHEQRLGLINHFRCSVTFREVAGFGAKPPEKRNQGLDHPINVDFAQVGQRGPWVLSSLHAKTPIGWASIELRRVTVVGKDPTG